MPRHPSHEHPTADRRTEEEPPHVTIKPDLTAQIPAELGAVHFVGIGGSGMSGIARLFLGAGHRVTGSDVRDSANIAALRELGADGRDRPRRRQRGRRRRGRRHGRALAGQPRVPARARARPPGAAPLAGARLAHRGAAPRVGRRRARQDHLDGHDRHGAARARRGPELRQRRRHRGARRQRGVRRGRALRGRGRRVRRLVPALRHLGRAHHERRPRPPRPLRLARRVRAGLRRLRRPGARARRHLLRRRRRHARRRRASRTNASSPSARRRTPRCACTPIDDRRSRVVRDRPTTAPTYRATLAHPRRAQRHQRRRRVRRARRARVRPRGIASPASRASRAPGAASSCTARSAA